MAKKRSSKTEKAPAIDRLLVPAIGIGFAFLAYYFTQGLKSEIPRIDVTDELALREVFFGEGGGKNYCVLCNSLPKEPGKNALPISSVFQDANYDGTANADFVLLDCEAELPSGKSVAERFGLDLKKRPTIFVSGKVGPPKQVPQKHLKTGAMLTKLLRQMLEPHAAKIENTKDLKAKCLNKPVCGLLLKGGKPEPYVRDAVSNLLGKHPDVQFASVDATVLLLLNLEEYLPEYESGHHRFVVFKKVSGGLEAGDNETEANGRLVTSIASLEDSVSFGSINLLVNGVKAGGKTMTKLPMLPTVKTRTKKLEEAERKKRERIRGRLEQQRKKKRADETPPGMFQANDGTKEGRKAERDRRRAEHLKDKNVKPKTPEEIAEMERRRRQRMEEEAEKWNIGAEDAPPEGDVIDEEEEDIDLDAGEEEYVDIDEGGEDGDEDEDILDLD